MRSLSHDIAFKAKVLQLGAALQNIKTSHCRKSQAGMSLEFVHLELCCYPPPTNPTNRSVTSLTKRQPHMRMWPLKQDSGLFSVCDVVFMDGGTWFLVILIHGILIVKKIKETLDWMSKDLEIEGISCTTYSRSDLYEVLKVQSHDTSWPNMHVIKIEQCHDSQGKVNTD